MSVSASSAASISPTTDPDLAAMRRVDIRNTVLKGMMALAVGWCVVFVVVVASGLTSPFHSPLGSAGATTAFFLLMLGHMAMMLDVALLGLFGLVHLLMNPRVSPAGKLVWMAAVWLTGFAGLVYFWYEVFPETGLDDESVIA